MDTANLKQELSLSLNEELKKAIPFGENIVVSMPGSFGEGIVVTDKRAIVLRERDDASAIDIFSYPLAKVIGAQAVASSTGGFIEIKLSESLEQQDAARVYFPSYDQSKFQQIADYINSLEKPAPVAAVAAAVANAPETTICSECSSVVEYYRTFCTSCGKQLRTLCSYCHSASPIGSTYCGYCGVKMAGYDPSCRNCGWRVQSWMTFCPQCGSIQGGKCASCGMRLIEGMQYCPSCGRQPGSDRLDAGAVRRARAVLGESAGEIKPVDEMPSQAAPTTGELTAEDHNQRGREFFESERFGDAIREFEIAVRLDPTNASYHCNLAVAYDEDDQDGDALIEYEKTLEIDPNDLTALLSLGYLHSERERYDKAAEAWNKIIAIAPDSPEAQEAGDNLHTQQQL